MYARLAWDLSMHLNYVAVGVFRVHTDPHSEERLGSVWARDHFQHLHEVILFPWLGDVPTPRLQTYSAWKVSAASPLKLCSSLILQENMGTSDSIYDPWLLYVCLHVHTQKVVNHFYMGHLTSLNMEEGNAIKLKLWVDIKLKCISHHLEFSLKTAELIHSITVTTSGEREREHSNYFLLSSRRPHVWGALN